MNIGMLWFDNDPKAALARKIERAADYYRSKYGQRPNLCFVHPSMLAAAPESKPPVEESGADPAKILSAGIEIRSTRAVLPNHLWIGVNNVYAGEATSA
jgi:hypothetical protein